MIDDVEQTESELAGFFCLSTIDSDIIRQNVTIQVRRKEM